MLREALKSDDEETLREILDANDEAYIKAFRLSVELGRVDYARRFRDAYFTVGGADLLHRAGDGFLLYLASCNGHIDITRYLIDIGADVHDWFCQGLRYACHYGHAEIVELYIDVGCDVHVLNDWCFKVAREHNHGEVLRLLES